MEICFQFSTIYNTCQNFSEHLQITLAFKSFQTRKRQGILRKSKQYATYQTNQLYPNSRNKSLEEAHGDYNDETYEDMNSASEEWSSSEEVTRGLFDQIVITRKPTHLQNLEAKLESDLNNL